ncbi:MAG: hypothetical protein Q4D04_09740 [Clostridia bacterium]|nr:hypothetical protein [Clostridia bacterium]
MKRLLGILMVLIMSIGCVGAFAEASVVDGARFEAVADVGGIEGSSFYIYIPSNMEVPFPMMTPVVYVYGDEPYSDEDAAWDMITAAGLDVIAEDEKAVIIAVNPVGENWGADDIDVYEAIMQYISFVDGVEKITYHSLQYAIGEGSGATFINDYLSHNCKRLAAVMTIGGDIGYNVPQLPLPAYIVGGSDEAVEYYIRANDGTFIDDNNEVLPTSGRVDATIEYYRSFWETEQAEDKTTHIFTYDDAKRVIVSNSDATSITSELVEDCWNSLFRYTARICLTANFWQYTADNYNDTTFTLVRRPNYDEAGMEIYRVDPTEQDIWTEIGEVGSRSYPYWYEFVPAAVQEAMDNNTGETFPLFLCFHGGGDHPIYEAESVGWAQLAIDNDIIMVAPNGSGAEEFNKLIDYMIEKYPVDITRIYAGGFSGGAGSTLNLSNAYPERLAAVAPQSRVSGPYYTDLLEKLDSYGYDLDLPICVVGQGVETESTNNNYEYVWHDCLEIITQINEIATPDMGALNFNKYPYWGFETENELRFGSPYPFAIWTSELSDADGVPLLKLMHTEQTTHTHYPKYANHIWEWMSQFTRDAETHEVVYTPAA